jgi:hypothetical protein
MPCVLCSLALAQRETLLHARDSAIEISENLAESRKFVKMIQRRMAQNKVRARALYTGGRHLCLLQSSAIARSSHAMHTHTHPRMYSRTQSTAEQARRC